MKANFAQADIKKLTILFLESSDPTAKRNLANKIWEKFHNKIEYLIVSYLCSKGININRMPEARRPEKYISEIYFEIYEKLFSVDGFEQKLKNYDAGKNIIPWLSTVVRNFIRDWLRRVDPECGLSNENKLRIAVLNSELTSSPNGSNMPPIELIADAAPQDDLPSEKNAGHALLGLLDQIELRHQVIIRIQYIAYIALRPKDIACLAELACKSQKKIRQEIDDLKQDLRAHPAFRKNMQKLKIQEAASFQIILSGKRVSALEKKLFSLGISPFELKKIQNTSVMMTFQEINKIRKRLSMRGSEIDVAKNQYMEAYKRVQKNIQKEAEIRSLVVSGRLFQSPVPSAGQLARIMNCKKQDIFNYRYRAKKALEKAMKNMKSKSG